jgi:hypothetical protein
MRRQRGVSTIAVAVIAMVAVAGVGFFTWQKIDEVEKLQAELMTTRIALDKARADLKKASQEQALTTRTSKDAVQAMPKSPR